jgi:hypothetical protein
MYIERQDAVCSKLEYLQIVGRFFQKTTQQVQQGLTDINSHMQMISVKEVQPRTTVLRVYYIPSMEYECIQNVTTRRLDTTYENRNRVKSFSARDVD